MRGLNVIKVGGALVEDAEALGTFLDGFASVPGPKILVHGGGRSATAMASRLGLETRMVGGRRVTDEDMLSVVTMVYGGLVNKGVVSALQARGIKALGLCGADLGCIIAHRRPPVMKDGELVDYGFAGDVDKVDAGAFEVLLEQGIVPVVAPLTFDGKGGLLNTNADTMASEVAAACQASRLTFCFEKAGVLSDPEDESSAIDVITPDSFERLKADGTVSGGMVPKLENAFAAISRGVGEVAITSAFNLSGGTVIREK